MRVCPNINSTQTCARVKCKTTGQCSEPVSLGFAWFPQPAAQMTDEQLREAMRVLARDMSKEARVLMIKRFAFGDSIEREP